MNINNKTAHSAAVVRAGKHTRRFLGAAIPAAVIALGVAAAVPAVAATGAAGPAAGRPAAAVEASKTPQVKAGKPFTVTSSVWGVRKGDRLALEAYYAYAKAGKRGWHVLGSWPMRAGQAHFRGTALAGTPGLYTLRVQFLRGGKLLPHSQSNTFGLKVLSFRVPRLSKPHAATASRSSAAAPDVTLTDWTDVECANPRTVGHGVNVPSPVTAGLSGQGEVAQVIWARNALPGGNYSAWYVAAVNPQYITQPQPNEFEIVEDADAQQVLSNQLTETPIDYSADTSDEFHQFAWDLAFEQPDGSWVWAYPTAWYTPGSYIQWDETQTGSFQSANCETYRTAGH